ncbi:hypothetical protein K8R78_00100 [bacterium]|nr:hypothetical protein [bacterium]
MKALLLTLLLVVVATATLTDPFVDSSLREIRPSNLPDLLLEAGYGSIYPIYANLIEAKWSDELARATIRYTFDEYYRVFQIDYSYSLKENTAAGLAQLEAKRRELEGLLLVFDGELETAPTYLNLRLYL